MERDNYVDTDVAQARRDSVLTAVPDVAFSVMPAHGGLTLLHTCRAADFDGGELLIFDSYILNQGTEPLSDVRLVSRSLSNADMTRLSYIEKWTENELLVGDLQAGAFVKFSARYCATSKDVSCGGPLVSSMSATAVTASGVLVQDEADVILEVGLMREESHGVDFLKVMTAF